MADVDWNLALYDPFKAQKEGSDYSKQIFDQAARLKAGAQYAAGDYASAAATLAQRGDFETAGKLSDLGTARSAGAQYAAGDYAGAGKTFATAGNIDEAGKLHDQQVKQFMLQHNTMKQVVPYLQDARTQGHDPVEAFKVIIPKLKSVGTTDDAIAQAQQGLASNPDQTLAAFTAMGNIDPEFKEFGGVGYVFDKNGDPTKPIATLGNTGVFRGNDLIAQAWNIVLDPKADRNSPQFKAAVTELQRTENRFDAATGVATSTTPRDISWLRAQGGQQGAGSPLPAPAPTGTRPPSVAPPRALAGTQGQTYVDTNGTPFRYEGQQAVDLEGNPFLPTGESRLAPDRGVVQNAPVAPPQSGPTPTPPAPTPTSRGTIYQSPNMTVRQVTPGNSGTLDREAIKNDARIWIASKGTISPQYGGGPLAQAQRNAFASEKNSIMKELGVSPEDVASGRASRVADTASLRQLTVMKGAISAYEATARNSAQLALGLLKKGGAQGQSPVLNRWIQAGRRSVLGDPDVAVFNNHLDTLADEYGKIMGGGTGSGAATEGARNEAHERINKADNAETIMRVIDALFQEMAGRTRSTDDEIATVKARLSGYGQGAASPAPAAAPPQGQPQRGPYAPGRGPHDDLLRKYGVQ